MGTPSIFHGVLQYSASFLTQRAQQPVRIEGRRRLSAHSCDLRGDCGILQKDASGRLFTAPRGCSPRCAGVLRSPRKRQPSKRRLTPIVPTHETAFSPVAKKAAKGNIRQPQIFYVRENSRLLHRRRATTGGFAQRTCLSQPKLEVDRRSVVRRRSGFPGTVADVSVPQTMT